MIMMPFIWMITTLMVNCLTTPVDDDERVFLENWYFGIIDIVVAFTSIYDSFTIAESYGVILGNVIAEVNYVFLLFHSQPSSQAGRCQE